MKRKTVSIILIISMFLMLLPAGACKVDFDLDFLKQETDVFLFMGGTNMSGCGSSDEAIAVGSGKGYEYLSVTGNDEDGYFGELKEPFGADENNSSLSDKTDGVNNKTGGLVSSFAKAYYEKTKIPVTGISASVSGASVKAFAPDSAYLNEAVIRLRCCVDDINASSKLSLGSINMVWCGGEADYTLTGDKTYSECLQETVAVLKNQGKYSVNTCFLITPSPYNGIFPEENAGGLISEIKNLQETDSDFILASTKFSGVPENVRDGRGFSQGVYNVCGYDAGERVSAYVRGGDVSDCTEFVAEEDVTLAQKYGIDLAEKSVINTYYFDSEFKGDSDCSLSRPCSDLTYLDKIEYKPGTKILFKCGSSFKQGISFENISGSEDDKIIISSYGTGDKPKFDGNDLTGSGVLSIKNCSHIVFSDLELYDSATEEGDRRGIDISFDNPSGNSLIVYGDITISNMCIHDIKGLTDWENNGMSWESKMTGGIRLLSTNTGTVDGLDIQNNEIYSCDNVGIATSNSSSYSVPYKDGFMTYCMKNVNIRSNEIYDIGKNAIFYRGSYGGVIEKNVVHDTATRCFTGNQIVTSKVWKTVIQYNEGYNNMARVNTVGGKGLMDGCMMDADLQSRDTVWQYNYSHDNSFGLFLNCTGTSGDDVDAKDKATVRYNISVCDKGNKGVLFMNYYSSGIDVYNNTFITDENTKYILYDKDDRNYHFYNNMIYDTSSSDASAFCLYNLSKATFNNNLVYFKNGITARNYSKFRDNCENIIEEDPMLVNTDYGELSDRTGYSKGLAFAKVSDDSPCLLSENAAEGEEITDIFGHKYKPCIGCYCG